MVLKKCCTCAIINLEVPYMIAKNKKRITITVSKDHEKLLKEMQEKTGLSYSTLITILIRNYLARIP